MSESQGPVPRVPGAILGRLLVGPLGAEARDQLARDHAEMRTRRGRFLASLWYWGHVLRPSTWVLARALRRAGRRAGTRGSARAPSRTAAVVSWLDVKLGLRMLVKHPGMTFVSGLAMAVTIAIAVGVFSVFQDYFLRPTVPLSEGERIVSLGLLSTDRRLTNRQLLHEFEAWKNELESVEELSIWRRARLNIVHDDGRAEPAQFGLMSAAGFQVARVPPLLGRYLLPSDEVPGAPMVVVIGYDDWLGRFAGDPDIIGREMQIGRDVHRIVGVMPEGYSFPEAVDRWLPFQDDPGDYAVMETPYSYWVFGRLAPGISLSAAQAEIATIGERRARELPDSHGHTEAIVRTFTDMYTGMDNADSTILPRLTLAVLSMLVLIPFVNVALLVYARTATRAGELSVRSALGASRRRVVMQLFVEASVLAAVACAAGVALVLFLFSRFEAFLISVGLGAQPFWVKAGWDAWVVAYAVGLTLLAGVVAGVIPGLKATGHGLGKRLQRTAGGNAMRLGRGWTALIVAQVATTVAFLPLVASVGWQLVGGGLWEPAFEPAQFVTAYVGAPADVASAEAVLFDDPTGQRAVERARARTSIEEVLRQVESDARVAGLALVTGGLPGTPFGANARVAVEGVAPPDGALGHRVAEGMSVSPGFFELLGVEAVRGRVFRAGDAEARVPPVVVNRRFVEKTMGGADPVGRRLRYLRSPDPRVAEQEPEPWREIIGVVGNLVLSRTHPEVVEPLIYTPYDRRELARGALMIMSIPNDPQGFVPEVRRITSGVDPTLELGTVRLLADVDDATSTLAGAAAVGFAVVLLSALLLCTAGIFCLMSFNVTQRRREIGVRSALGAAPRRVLASVMARSAGQLLVGLLVGLGVVLAIPPVNVGGVLVGRAAGPIVVVTALMLGVGLLAAVGPAREGLRIQPSEALRQD